MDNDKPALPDREVVARVIDLKTWPSAFAAVRDGLKPWELRKNDREYQVGDVLRLREWDPAEDAYSGEIEERTVTWMLHGGQFGLPEGYVIMSLALSPAQAEREEHARVGKLLAAMDWVGDPFVDGTTPHDEVQRCIRFMLDDRDRAMLSAAPKEPDHG